MRELEAAVAGGLGDERRVQLDEVREAERAGGDGARRRVEGDPLVEHVRAERCEPLLEPDDAVELGRETLCGRARLPGPASTSTWTPGGGGVRSRRAATSSSTSAPRPRRARARARARWTDAPFVPPNGIPGSVERWATRIRRPPGRASGAARRCGRARTAARRGAAPRRRGRGAGRRRRAAARARRRARPGRAPGRAGRCAPCTTSLGEPVDRVVTTGRPSAIASSTEVGRPSRSPLRGDDARQAEDGRAPVELEHLLVREGAVERRRRRRRAARLLRGRVAAARRRRPRAGGGTPRPARIAHAATRSARPFFSIRRATVSTTPGSRPSSSGPPSRRRSTAFGTTLRAPRVEQRGEVRRVRLADGRDEGRRGELLPQAARCGRRRGRCPSRARSRCRSGRP